MANTEKKEPDSPKITAREINLPKGGGAIKGMGDSFQPNFFTGTGSYTIPLPVPASRGLEPELSLNYNSGSGNGAFGMGFSLSLSKISINTSKRIPRYDGTDTYISSEAGELVKQISQDNVTRYLPRIENQFSKIERLFDPITGDLYWRIVSKNNITSYYGRSANSRVTNPSDKTQVFEWLIDETRDAKGNKIIYTYKQENDENIPPSIYEVNRMYAANRYIQCIQYGNYLDDQNREVFAFELAFDYGEYELSDPAHAHTPSKPWLYRPDAFSFYNSGFEIRTCRLCKAVLLFHHFVNESPAPLLTKSVAFTYKNREQTSAGNFEGPSLLSAVQITGYKKNADNTFSNKSLPPLGLKYSAFIPPVAPVFGRLQMGTGTIPGRVDGSQFIPIDLYGEGLPGFLCSNNETCFYLEPQGDGKYSMPQYQHEFPINKNLQGTAVAITDIDGNGELELLVTDAGKAGYYQYKDDGSWDKFRSFPSYPLDIADPQIEYIDLDANGKTDLLLAGNDDMLVYFSEGKKGYQPGKRVRNENGFPLTKQGYEEELVAFANIFGDGLSHRVKISNGLVECWPCLGYGNYAKKITLGRAPAFENYFDRGRLFFADLDGSGTADMIYVYPSYVEIFLNQSGNSFSDAIRINLPDVLTELDQISFSDILGNGTSCLVFSKMTPVPVHYYYNFAGEIILQNGKERTALKPYLLNEIDNNLGAVTQISYCSSTRFYLEDKKAERPWVTKLHFPVQVVEQVTMIDKISASVFVNKFKYHDGYYDPVEREFCGFGFVESWDTQTYEEYTASIQNPDFPVDRLNKDLYVPPVYTRTWYNTGSFESNPVFFNVYKKEYFRNAGAYDFPASVLQAGIYNEGAETLRQACFALKGQVMRTEVYANDESSFAHIPYTISEFNAEVILNQPKQENKYAAFMVIPRENISYNLERNELDPVIRQEFVLETDLLCGLANTTCSVYLPRRSSPTVNAHQYPGQEQLKAVVSTSLFINTDKPLTGYWRGMACEEKTFELFNLEIKGKQYFTYSEVKAQAALAFEHAIIPYNEELIPGELQLRQYSWSRQYFWNAVQKTCSDYLPLKDISPQGLLHHEEKAVFTNEWIGRSFGDKLSEAVLTNDAGYIFEMDTGYWWNRGLIQYYLDAKGFYLPYITENCFAEPGSSLFCKTETEFDTPYYLLPVKSTNYLGTKKIESGFSIDYQCLSYKQTVDSNKNVGQVLFDPLGQVIATTLFGTENGVETGGMRIYAYDGKPAEYELREAGFEEIINDPLRYLQGVVSYFYYNLYAWQQGETAGKGQPACSVTLAAQQYYRPTVDPLPLFSYQLLINYSDGFGRNIGQKQWAGGISVDSKKSKSKSRSKATGTLPEEQWLNSGRIVYNNKGKACQEYLPFFDCTPYYESQKELENNKEIAPPSVTHYDALERIIRIDTPKGFFSKVEYTPWEVKKFDENDTVTESEFYKTFVAHYSKNPNPTQAEKDEMDALEKAKKFYHTPSIEVMDNMGFVICSIQTMPDRQIAVYRINDIQGRQLELTDARLYRAKNANNEQAFNFRYRYMMDDEDPFYTNSADNGIQLALNNVYGNQLCCFDAMNYCQFISYDELQRKTELRVKQLQSPGPVIPLKDFDLVEQIIYGESQSDGEKYNLYGQIYQLNDLSGTAINKSYSLQGQVLETWRQIPDEYQKEIIWNGPFLPLLGKAYYFGYTYNALKLVLTSTTPDNTVTSYTYNQLGLAATTTVTYADGNIQHIIRETGYSPGLQRAFISYGNGITTRYSYEKTTQNLLGLFSQRPGTNLKNAGVNTTVQNISYTYDPVGNITRMWDFSYETVFNNNQQVDPCTDYTYDAIYRLISANGRQHPGISGGTYMNNKPESFKQSIFSKLPCINDNCKLENYTETYEYDDSDNLVKKQHTALSASFTVDTVIEQNSNRLKEIRISGLPDTTVGYDASGNQTTLFLNKNLPLSFNCYENLIKAAIIKRPDEPGDAEYYLYDSTGTRTRKVTERLAENGTITEITEKIYLGNYEIKRNKRIDHSGKVTTKLERQTLRVMDDETCIAIIHYWEQDVLKREVDAAGQRSVRFQMGNNLGSVSMEMDIAAKLISYEEYFPYGGTAIIAGENEAEVALKDYRYSGKECDDCTGLYYYGSRYYISWLGRWLSADPAGPVDGLNLYAFVKCNPVKFIDQTGDISVGGARVLLNIASLFLVVAGPVWGAIVGAREGASQAHSTAGKIGAGILGGIIGGLTGLGLGLINTILTPVRWVVEPIIALARWLGPETNAAAGTYPAVLYNATQRTNVGIDFNTGRFGAETIAEHRGIPRSLWPTLIRPFNGPNLNLITGSPNFNGTLIMVGHGNGGALLETIGFHGDPGRVQETGTQVEHRLRGAGLNWAAVQRIDMSICIGDTFGANLSNAINNHNALPAAGIITRTPTVSVSPLGNLLAMGHLREVGNPVADFLHWMTGGIYSPNPIESAAAAGGPGTNIPNANNTWRTIRT
jgi:RHS repeat-associated protein